MADKRIDELPAIATLTDNAMIPVEQSGAAGRISGLQFKNFAIDSVSEYVGQAFDAADEATASAQTASEKASAAANSASAASGDAAAAEAAKNKILGMTATAETLLPGSDATVTKTEVDGVVNLAFAIPQGQKGDQGIQGPQGPQGVQGPKGDTGTAVAVETAGMFYFSVNNNSESPTYGHLILTYTGDSPPDIEIDANGHLIWTVE